MTMRSRMGSVLVSLRAARKLQKVARERGITVSQLLVELVEATRRKAPRPANGDGPAENNNQPMPQGA
jgi:hypothetical protein